MKNGKQTKQKYVTYKQLVDELAKFKDQTDPACIIASTDIGSPGKGENFIDGSGVKSVSVNSGVVVIDCGDSGIMTWEQIRTALRDAITLSMADQPAIVRIGYTRGGFDFNGKPCRNSRILDCSVLPEDMIWNVHVGPAV